MLSDYQPTFEEISEILNRDTSSDDKLKSVMNSLRRSIPHYDWVGLYLLYDDELKIGPFSGSPTPHTEIDIDSGICGACVREEKTIIVPDVSSDDRYLACSLETKSEIVVPIFHKDEVIGVLDIDSHRLNAFSEGDVSFLERVIDLIKKEIKEIS